MSTQELQMVLEAVSGLGDAGKSAFMLWVAAAYGAGVVKVTVVAAGFVLTVRGILRIYMASSTNRKALEEALRYLEPKEATWYFTSEGALTGSGRDRLMRALQSTK